MEALAAAEPESPAGYAVTFMAQVEVFYVGFHVSRMDWIFGHGLASLMRDCNVPKKKKRILNPMRKSPQEFMDIRFSLLAYGHTMPYLFRTFWPLLVAVIRGGSLKR